MSFYDLRLAEPIVRAVVEQGYSAPTPIQAQAIPAAVDGRDILGCAQTGTGKTCAFALPILHRLMENTSKDRPSAGRGGQGRAPRALILAPTRELASQIFDSFNDYGRNLPLRHTVVFGGVNQHRQVRAMRAGVDVLVATPGRLLDLINQGHIDLRSIESLVLDEADRMLDMGFIGDIQKVVKMLPRHHQTLFFSATVSREIRQLADTMLNNPVCIETAPEATTIDAIEQRVYMVEKHNKPEMLERLFAQGTMGRTLVFTKTKHGADKLVKHMKRAKINADAIHGNKTQNARTKALQGFKSGRTQVLVATDIASRGIDVDEITHVINFDMPIDPETYVHRIGRTARAGATGIAVSFCDRDELRLLRAVERRARISIEVATDHNDIGFKAPPMRPAHHGPAHRGPRKPGSGRPGSGKHRSNRGHPNGDQPRDEFADSGRPAKPGNRANKSGKKASKRSGKPNGNNAGGWGSSNQSTSTGPAGRRGKPKAGGRNAGKPGAGKPGAGVGKKRPNTAGRSRKSPTA